MGRIRMAYVQIFEIRNGDVWDIKWGVSQVTVTSTNPTSIQSPILDTRGMSQRGIHVILGSS
jgi:hypothetical protein